MRILYGYANCTDKTYNRIMGERGVYAMIPDQKYHSLLIRGLAANGASLYCLSGLPVNRAVTARRLVREPDEREENVHYHYITTLNLPGLRQLMIFFGTLFGVLRAKKDAETVAVCDCLNIANALGMTLAAKLRRIPVVSVVTDLPELSRGSARLRKLNGRLLRRADAFVFLTEAMNRRVNPDGKPAIVMEGHVDADAPVPDPQTAYEAQTGVKAVLYAGSTAREYGIETLVSGFLQADVPNAALHVYGKGDYTEALQELARQHPSVCCKGVVPNSEVVAEEQRVSLLVNPRPTAPEFTRYSFPSKNMEYMLSGTPLLTTRLPGMPVEYYPYVYLLEDETPAGVAAKLREILMLPLAQRQQKGAAARRFVLENKTNVAQARRLLAFLRGEVIR